MQDDLCNIYEDTNIIAQIGEGQHDQNQINRDDENNFFIFDEHIQIGKKYGMMKKDVTLKIKTPRTKNIIEYLKNSISQIFEYIEKNMAENSKVGIVFDVPGFIHGAGVLSYRFLRNLTVDNIWDLIFKITQSRTEFKIDEKFNIKICSIEMPYGSGRNKKATMNEHRMRGIVVIKGNDNMCFPKAVITSIAHTDCKTAKDNTKAKYTEKYNNYKRITQSNGTYQLKLAQDLCKNANVKINPEGCGILEFKKFQKYLLLEKSILKIYEMQDSETMDIIYNGENMLSEKFDFIGFTYIFFLRTGNHFDVITSLLSCVNRRKYCEACNISYNRTHQK